MLYAVVCAVAVAVAVARREPIPNLPFLTHPPQRYTDPINIQIAAAIKAHPEIPREELWVTTKVPCCPNPQLSYCNDREYNGTITEAMRRNNALLQLRSTDITLVRLTFTSHVHVSRSHANDECHTHALVVSEGCVRCS